MKAMDIAAGHLEVSRRELARSGDLSWRRSVVSWALTDRRSMVIEDGKGVRPRKLASILESGMATEGSDKGALQSGAEKRSICKNCLEGEALGKRQGLKDM